MKIYINQKETEVETGKTVGDLAKAQNLPENGVAIAVNGKLVQRKDWVDTELKENDAVLIVNAAYGG
ncbi:MAG: sulfur carrier protein ThiS [Paludibacteraceae bacterium]|nr:sulfur carrier protein ThiS [Paludibacteraceae bacterium]MCR5298681.1 sulfur carrier protein ThiS [Paludibacteraceae bacterium]